MNGAKNLDVRMNVQVNKMIVLIGKCMSKCFKCKHKGELSHVCDECIDGEMYEKTVITNGDRIRSMTDEELAKLMDEATDYFNCDECEFRHSDDCGTSLLFQRHILKWLKSEIK